jgi:folate-binding protein YgfZ
MDNSTSLPGGEAAPDRRLWRIAGADRDTFLQGLVTNDVRRLAAGPLYAALLTPQGKYVADFFLVPDGDGVVIDLHESIAEATARRLALYRLRAAVTIEPDPRHVVRGPGAPPPGAFADPRDPGMGWRALSESPGGPQVTDWDVLRVAHLVPETWIELTPDTYILEAGFERLHGVDFRKGCYVGQEVTARMKHKTELRKGLVAVRVAGQVPCGTAITAGDRAVGTLFTQAGGMGIAHLRLDRADQPMQAGTAAVTLA